MAQSTEEQSAFTNEVPIQVEKKSPLHVVVGEYLAAGFTNDEILTRLQEEQKLTLEEAQVVLRGVYDSWTSVRAGLNLQSEDDRNWHHHLRMKLLQGAIADVSTPSQRLALQILDSIATLQGIDTVPALPVPLAIELVEKKPEPKDTGDKNGREDRSRSTEVGSKDNG